MILLVVAAEDDSRSNGYGFYSFFFLEFYHFLFVNLDWMPLSSISQCRLVLVYYKMMVVN
jgi:hypothetical protein